MSRDSESLSAKLCLIWFPSPLGSGRAAPESGFSASQSTSLQSVISIYGDCRLLQNKPFVPPPLLHCYCNTTSCIKHQSWYVAEITELHAINIVQLSACNLCSAAFNIQVLLDNATTQNCNPRSPFSST